MDHSTAYSSLTLVQPGPLVTRTPQDGQEPHGQPLSYCARFDVERDLAPLFPYINAVAEDAQYYERPEYIKFMLQGHLCAFYPRQGLFAPVADLNEATDFLSQLLTFVEYIEQRRNGLKPNHKRYRPVSPLDIFRLLPGTNCKACGHATCLAFAAALSRQKAKVMACPYISHPLEEKASFPVFDSEGNCLRTVSLHIDSAELRDQIDEKDAYIKELKAQLAAYETHRALKLDQANSGLPSPLTPREMQVLQRLAQGATNPEISHDLRISEHTVKSHVIHIFNKLGVNDRTQASVWAASHGLL